MENQLKHSFRGKRFTLAVLIALLLTSAFFFGTSDADGVAKFGQFALYLTGIFTAYCTGQSITDYQKAKNGA